MSKKNNQAKSYFSYKNDDPELVEVGQFIRDVMPKYRVEREWYVLFSKDTGEYVGHVQAVPMPSISTVKYKIRNPDLMILDKKTGDILLIIEIDGGVHDKKMFDTEERNRDYNFARIPLLIINKLEIETTIFDLVHKKIQELLELNK